MKPLWTKLQQGQAMLEYALVCAALSVVLLAPIRDEASPGEPRSTIGILIEGFKTAYQKFSYALSLPG